MEICLLSGTESLELLLEKNKVTFGITENVKTFNPIKITFMNWIKMIEDFKNSANSNERFNSFFGPPEWNLNKSKNHNL